MCFIKYDESYNIKKTLISENKEDDNREILFTVLKNDIKANVLKLNDDELKKYFLTQKLNYNLGYIKYFDYKNDITKNINNNFFQNGVYFEYVYNNAICIYQCNISNKNINFTYITNIKDIN